LKQLMSTTPFSTATPHSAMKPMAALMLKGRSRIHSEHAAGDGERDAGVDDERLHDAFESGVDEHKDEHQRQRHDDHEPCAGLLQMLKLAAEIDAVAFGHLDGSLDLFACGVDVGFGSVPPARSTFRPTRR
jgi:hypothetical protein